MRKILLWLFVLVFTASLARAQDDAAQQQIDKLSGQIQDVLDAQAAQGKRIDALEKQIGDLQDKLNAPGAGGNASADDLKKLAGQVQEIDKKRQSDNEQILKELEKLDKALGVAAPSHKPSTSVAATGTNNPASVGPQKGYEYTIAPGDNLSAIAKAYRAQGVKVTVEQIQMANPGLNPKNLVVGKKVFIPDANAK
ncbi:MAG TPA: LysM peptidoglycan-binding domain-containing protein [Methylomirabilota bacterium]|nr:LysM peptidoglycan-binding domain-containing protein [Methylomirabilota bacterium]